MDKNIDIDKAAEFIPVRLKIARISRDFKNRSTFAKFCGAPITTYRAHERGDNELKVTDAIRYAEALNISVWWLLTGKSHPFAHMNEPSALEAAKFDYNIRVEASKVAIKEEIEKTFGHNLDGIRLHAIDDD